MKPLHDPRLDDYARRHSRPPSAELRRLERLTMRSTDLPQMMVGSLEGAFLYLLAKVVNARRVVEIGTFTGYSALWMAEALPANGRLITIDRDERTMAIARSVWKRSPHGRKIEGRLGDAPAVLKTLPGTFDLAFIDADKENYGRYWEWCLSRVRRGGLIAVDNVLWSGRVLKPKDPTDRALKRFGGTARRDPRVETVLLTVRDGVLLARKK